MEYIKRNIEEKFMEMNEFFKAILVTGARQVGKTTMLKNLAKDTNRSYVTLDDLMDRELAKRDPVLFFQKYQPPIIIDEVQYAPELFPQIKIICDNSEEAGLFWLTGSQQFSMMKNVRESLAGRIGILSLHSLSRQELSGINYSDLLDFSPNCLKKREKIAVPISLNELYEHIWKGGMPTIQKATDNLKHEFFNAYVDTHLMRDVAQLGGVIDTLKFRRFLTACASLVAEQVNYKTLADSAEIAQTTAKEWLKLLEGMGIIYLLKPYFNNHLKRLTKTSKLYFCDTGLCAYLSMWLTKETLMNGAASGKYFENFVVMEIFKNYLSSGVAVDFYYYRDSNAKEIDMLVSLGNTICPIEIKKSGLPDSREVKKFDVLKKVNESVGHGGIVCMCERSVPIDDKNSFISVSIL